MINMIMISILFLSLIFTISNNFFKEFKEFSGFNQYILLWGCIGLLTTHNKESKDNE